MEILVVGSVGLDSITTPHGKREEVVGGSASHFAMSASYFAPVNMVAVVGKDFPEETHQLFRRHKIDLEGLQIVEGRTFRWSGYYNIDYHKAYTLETQLNVFSDFKPVIPDRYQTAECIFLGNIDPVLQLQVLDQVKEPKLVVGDTMNFWIESKRDEVIALMKRVDVMLLNDQEARDLGETHDMIRAGRRVLGMGPRAVVIKKGEHGAVLFHGDEIFIAPAYPYSKVVDPTGAGDSFAGGFVGHLARTGDPTARNFRQAIIYGSIMGSFNIEDFSLYRISQLAESEIATRYDAFRELTRF
ncbi:MAG: sugar kinase [Candidatus Wallbacteria bacterium]|nr:sugar kinase [Candidatus Wallbacteria bacterium]MBI4867171.1 sugar kinase [Candidatus Wallbacteria bacterium]